MLFHIQQVYDGMTKDDLLISTLCDLQEIIAPISSTGNVLLVVFKSDVHTHHIGFEAQYISSSVVKRGLPEGKEE